MSQAGAGGPAAAPKMSPATKPKAPSPRAPVVAPRPASPVLEARATAEKATAPLAPKHAARTVEGAAPRVAPPPLPPVEPAHPPNHPPHDEPKHVAAAPVLTEPGVGTSRVGDAARTGDGVPELIAGSVEQALGPLRQTIHDLRRRVEELERRPVGPLPAGRVQLSSFHEVETAAPPLAGAPHPGVALPRRATLMSYQDIDVAAIVRDPTIVVDAALDGRGRRRKAVATLVLILLAVFGGLGYMLANSYAHH